MRGRGCGKRKLGSFALCLGFLPILFSQCTQIEVPLSAPSDLLYQPTTLSVVSGQSASSNAPVVNDGNSEIIEYRISSGVVEAIAIDGSTGVITVSGTSAIGDYLIDVSVTNSVGTAVFPGVFTVSVLALALAPVSVAYVPNQVTLSTGEAYTSEAPLLNDGGSTIIAFSLIGSVGGISISAATGLITVSSSIAAGTYTLGVRAENAAGVSDFPGALIVTVQNSPPVTFTGDILPIIEGNCTPCHTGGSQVNLTNYSNAKSRISTILDRINRPEGSIGFMPNSGSKLSDATIALFTQWQNDGLLEN